MKKTATIGFGGKEKISCESTGVKDPWGDMIWKSDDGRFWNLAYARHARTYAFRPRKTEETMEYIKTR